MTRSTRHVIVIGGGLAGLSAAIDLADKGQRVTLLEARPRFGGATWSFKRNGLSFDNGQHVFLACCHAYRQFLSRIGSTDLAPLQDRLSIPVLRARGGGLAPIVSVIERGRLPGRAGLGPSLLSYRHLSVVERLRALRALFAISRLSLTDSALDEESFGSFLARHGQSRRAISALFELIVLPTVNLRADEASLKLAAKVFKTGLLEETGAADLGWSTVPLSRLHVDPALEVLKRSGATVRSRAKVSAIEMDRDSRHAIGVRVDGEILESDAVVLAVPHESAAALIPGGSTIQSSEINALSSSPIIDVHLVYDRPVLDRPLVAALGSPVQFVFDRTEASGLSKDHGQCIALSVSGADQEHGMRADALIERYTAAIIELLPLAQKASLVDAVVSREHTATFRGAPGTDRLRPGPDIGFANLFLAGAWTDTGWPATMEGAVRSGRRAAFLAGIESATDTDNRFADLTFNGAREEMSIA